jgi:hypothetical protein
MAEQQAKKPGLFSAIQDRDGAIKIARDCGNAFLMLAVLQGAIGLFLARSLLVDAAIFALCGLYIRRSYSRAAAILCLAVAAFAAVTTFANRVGANVGGGKNIFLAVIMLWVGIRAVEATFKLHGKFRAVTTV